MGSQEAAGMEYVSRLIRVGHLFLVKNIGYKAWLLCKCKINTSYILFNTLINERTSKTL